MGKIILICLFNSPYALEMVSTSKPQRHPSFRKM